MLQQEFEQLTGIKVSAEDFATINEMYMNAGDDMDKQTFCNAYKNGSLISDMPEIIREIKAGVESSKDKEHVRGIIKYQNKIHDMEMQIAEKDEFIREKDEVIREKDEQLQEHLEVLKKTIKEYMNLGQYEQISAFKTLFVFSGKGEKDWVEFLCNVARSNN